MTIPVRDTITAVIETLPGSWYTDPAILAAERATVLQHGWRYVGDAGAVASPGSYLAARAGGCPVVIARDGEGQLHASVNVCRHRGAEVAASRGTASSLTCRYHGWSYRLDGSLESSVGTQVPDGVRLPAADAEAVGPLLFAASTPQQRRVQQTLRPFLDLVNSVSGVDLATLRLRASIDHTVRANWKVLVENFIECYHCPLVHATTLPGYGRRDYTTTIHESAEVTSYGRNASLHPNGFVHPQGGDPESGLLQTQHLDADKFSFAFLAPTTQISAYGNGRAVVAREVVPVDVGTTFTRLDYWFADDVADREVDEWVTFFESVIAEDEPMCESVQRGLETGTYDHGYLHPDRERGLVHFQSLVRDSVSSVLEVGAS